MPIRPNLPANVTYISPPAAALLAKIVQIARTDTTAFDAFVLPPNAVIAGAYCIGSASSNAGTAATIQVGTAPGTSNEIVNNYDVKTAGAGYFNVASAGGSGMGTQTTAETRYKARYVESGTASSAGGPWLVKVEYYLPQPGQTY